MEINQFAKWKILSFAFLQDFIFLYPFYNMMFYHYGVSKFYCALLLVIIQVSKILFDLPSGIIADKYGRKNLFIVGQLMRIFAILIWLIGHKFMFFAIGAMFWGSSMSTFYGNLEAYIYDEMNAYKQSHRFSVFLGHYYAIQNISIALATILSSQIFKNYSFIGVILLSVISLLGSIAIAIRMPDEFQKNLKHDNINADNESIWSILRIMIQDRILVAHMILVMLLDGIFFFTLDLQTNLMINFGLDGSIIAILVGIVSCARMMINLTCGSFVKYISITHIIRLIIISAIVFMYNGYSYTRIAIGITMSYSCLSALLDLSIKSKIQSLIPRNRGALIMSCASLMASCLIIVFHFINGIVATFFSYGLSMCAIGILMLIIIFIVCKIGHINILNNEI